MGVFAHYGAPVDRRPSRLLAADPVEVFGEPAKVAPPVIGVI